MSSLATATEEFERERPLSESRPRQRVSVPQTDAVLAIAIGAALSIVAFVTGGGSDLAPNTWVEIALIATAGVAGISLLVFGARQRRWGVATLALFGGLAALTYASIAWSVQPASSWLEANRTLSYLGAFATAWALARIAPGRWAALVAGVAAFASVVCGYALIAKVFPGTFDAGGNLGRLAAPSGYWNATGLTAAMGLPAALWAGSRREGGPVLRALSMPAIAILIPVLLLSWSRSALLAAVIGVGCWIALTPVRLRAALVLAVGAVGGALASIWALVHPALTHDGVSVAARSAAGHRFGVVMLVICAAMVAAGWVTARAMDRVTVSPQVSRRIGIGLVTLVALIPIGGVVALAMSSRGLPGQVEHAWNNLVNPNSNISNAPGRITQLGSSRPRYWSDGLKVGEHALLAGTGALGYATTRSRYSADSSPVVHAHSYAVETFADFGVLGVALSLGVFAAWVLAVRRIRTGGQVSPEINAERAGLYALLAVTVAFGVQSLIDWTWFIPGVTIPALVCAGWLAGRGPLVGSRDLTPTPRRSLATPGRAAAAIGIVAATGLAVWMVWQPLRSANAVDAATASLIRGDTRAALAQARTAASSDPVSVDPLSELAAIYTAMGDHSAAHRELQRATTVQPGNPSTWESLGEFDFEHSISGEALEAAKKAENLAPKSSAAQGLLRQASALAAQKH